VEDLMLELTRAANYVCDMVREYLFPSFRLKEGVLLVETGPFMDFKHRIYRAEYRGPEKTEMPYPGLETFKKVRHTRDFSVGYGSTAYAEREYRGKAQQANPADGE
jgi:hypothetical protein